MIHKKRPRLPLREGGSLIHPFRQSKSLTPWLSLCVVVAGFAGCGGSTDVDMGQSPGAGSAASGGSLNSGGGPSSPNLPGAGAPSSSPCGPTPCADHTGDKTFVESDTPPNAPDQFDAATPHEPGTDDSRQPAIVYPSHETMFPINVSHIRHDWTAGNNDLFELRFVGSKTTVTVYTASPTWTPSDEQWDWIAESNRGGAVELTVSGLDRAHPEDSWLSEPNTSLFSESAVEGAIYYWSTGTKGIMRATVGSPLPEKFYTDPSGSDSESCAACHTLSRDGKRLAVGYNGERLREVSVPERATIVPVGDDSATEPDPAPAPEPKPGMPMPAKPMPAMPKPPNGMMGEGMAAAWTTFSPDGEMLLVAANGVLTLIDSDTGQTIGDNSGVVGIPSGGIATHPDWAATGDKVAIALGTKGGNKEIEAGSIAILPYTNGAWGEAEVVVASSSDKDNNFFPVWSPDSKWLAYVHAEGKSRDAVSAELRLLDMSARKVVSLVRVNQRVSNVDGVMGVGNSMPTWAPSTKPGTFWLAFSSVRAYSVVRPLDDKADQIWIAAIEPSSKGDPSFPAFWAPFQSIAEGNHRAFWTHASDDTQCRCVDVCGDSLDNDCDGTADEAGCSECVAEEICGDGIDNDCDCVVDDCNGEICGDGIDNDGDGNVDFDDPQCQVK
jgi:hypothetical protein